jgi:hypothetical protein
MKELLYSGGELGRTFHYTKMHGRQIIQLPFTINYTAQTVTTLIINV